MARRFHRARHHLGNAGKGLKGSAFSIASGAAVAGGSSYALSALPFLQTNWWAMPAALALVGHFIKRKNSVIGDALLGTAGYLTYFGFVNRNVGATTPAKGFIDAGMLLPGSSDAGALFGVSSYNDSRLTDASPAMGTAQAAMLYTPSRGAGEFIDAGGSDAMGIEQ